MIISPVSISSRAKFRDGCRVTRNRGKVREAYRMMRRAGMPAYDARYVVIQMLVAGMSAEVAQR